MFPAAIADDAGFGKTVAAVQAARGLVVRIANHRNQLADAERLGLTDQLTQQQRAQALATGFRSQVDAVLRAVAEGRTWPEPVAVGKARYLAVQLCHQPGQVAAVDFLQSLAHLVQRGWFGFECAGAMQHMVAVDGGNAWQVGFGGRPDLGRCRHGTELVKKCAGLEQAEGMRL